MEVSQKKLEGAREALRQANFYRRPYFEKKLRDHDRTVPGNMHFKFEDRSFNRFYRAMHVVLARYCVVVLS